MRRIVLAIAMTTGLAIGSVVPASALGETSVTLTCDDGTSSKLLVDTNTLTALTQAVQAMIDYPAGLSCTLIQNPLGVSFGAVAFASSEPFVVGGGRYQLTCPTPPDFPGAGLPESQPEMSLAPNAPLVASATPADQAASEVNRIKLTTGSLYQPLATDTMYWVNIAVNYHMKDGSSVGTLNETIPAGQCVPQGHFTSKPFASCLDTSTPNLAFFPTVVTQTSGESTENNFFKLAKVIEGDFLRWSFFDNGNPGQQTAKDRLNGTFDGTDSTFSCTPTGNTAVFPDGVILRNGNITIHP